MSVKAVLNQVTDGSSSDSSTLTTSPTPTPDSLIGNATCVPYGFVTDLVALKVQYNFQVYQTYSTASGDTGLAQVTGKTNWISIPGASRDFPNVKITPSVSSSVTGGVVTFVLTSSVSYTKTTPGIFDLQTV